MSQAEHCQKTKKPDTKAMKRQLLSLKVKFEKLKEGKKSPSSDNVVDKDNEPQTNASKNQRGGCNGKKKKKSKG